MTHFKNCCWARWVRYNWESHSNLNKFKSWARGFQFSLALKVWKLAYWRHFMPERQCAMLISRPLFYQIHKKKHQDRHTLWNEGTLTSGKLHILVHDQYVFYFFSDLSPYQNTWLITSYVQDSIWMQCFCSIENREFLKLKGHENHWCLKKILLDEHSFFSKLNWLCSNWVQLPSLKSRQLRQESLHHGCGSQHYGCQLDQRGDTILYERDQWNASWPLAFQALCTHWPAASWHHGHSSYVPEELGRWSQQ